MSNTIVCRKFGVNPNLNWNEKNNLLPLYIRKIKTQNFEDYILVSTNGKLININGVEKELGGPSLALLKTGRLLVLTAKEYDVLVNLDISLSNRLYVFEKEFPIFNDIKYIPVPHIMISSMRKKLNKVRKLGYKNKNIISDLLHSHQKKTFKKVTKKSSLDSCFYNVIGGGYQEIFKFKEESENRVVIALDFNSMFPSCMSGEFINPKNLFYIDFKDEKLDEGAFLPGLYRVIFSNPIDDQFNKHHPFKYRVANQSFNFELTKSDKVDVILHHFELDYYKRFFEKHEVIEGVISSNSISHPLFSRATRLYNQRLGFKKNLDSSNELLAKFKLVSMHSVTNPVKINTKKFNVQCKLIQFLEQNFSFSFEEGMSDNDNIKIINSFQQFTVLYHDGTWTLKYPNVKNNESIYCFSSTIIARSRLKMVKAIMSVLKFESVDLCYCNIDSLHISVEKNKLDNLMSGISCLISPAMGDFKVEAIADKGYWFDVGRYWLIDDSSVIKYRNVLFNRRGKNDFNYTRVIQKIVKNDFFDYIKNFNLHLFNSFSYAKRLGREDDFFHRYTYNEINTFNVANETIIEEMLQSKTKKIISFRKIKCLYGKENQ